MKNLLLFLILLLATNVSAQWSSDTTLNNPICLAADYQRNPQLTTDGDGGAIIVWEDRRTFSNQNDIYAQLINSDGYVQWTSDGISVSSAADDQVTPQITTDENGGAILVWQDNRTGNADIYAQRINNNGTCQWTADGIPICTATNQQFGPKIISDGNGGAIIVWKDYRSGFGYDIYAQRIDADGNTLWTADGIVICDAVNEQSYQQIINDSNGGAIIAWQDKRPGAFDIYAQRIDLNGNSLWQSNGVRVCTNANDQLNSQIVSDGTGGALIVWRDNRQAVWDIYAQRINQNGTRLWDTSGVAVCLASGSQFSPEIASDLNGGAIICWEDYRSGNYSDLYAQRIDPNGNILWIVNGVEICTAENNQRHPHLISSSSAGAVMVWEDHRRSSEEDIYAQRIDTNGNTLWMTNGVATSVPTDDQTVPRLIFSDNSGAIITWEDRRNGNYDIYASLVDTSGNLVGGPVYVNGDNQQPHSFELYQNFPNPFNPLTSIQYAISNRQFVALKVYDLLGREVATLVNEEKSARTYEVTFDASGLSSGIYLYRLQAGNFIQTKKMILLK